MTDTQERTPLEVVPDESSKEQGKLELGAPPRWTEQVINVSAIKIERFGAPPSAEMRRSVEASGVWTPILIAQGSEGFDVIDGRRRVLAAIGAGLDTVPARLLVSGNRDLIAPAISLEANDAASPNPLVELEAIESLIAYVPGLTLPEIARAVGVKLKTLRARMRLSRLDRELRAGGLEGRFGAKVAEAAARCNETQQRELVSRMTANGSITLEDVREVKKAGVRDHQRQLPVDNTAKRAIGALNKIRGELFLAFGKEHEAVKALDDAIAALEDEDGA